MTRRYKPEERIFELSGASVPFPYDVHECCGPTMHPSSKTPSTNSSKNGGLNWRTQGENSTGMWSLGRSRSSSGREAYAQFIKKPEAREYRQTLAKREESVSRPKEPGKVAQNLFGTAA